MPAWMEVIMDEGMSREKSLQARISADEAAFAQRQAALQNAENSLADSGILAPADGIIISRNAEIGQTVTAGSDQPPLFLVATDLTVMETGAKVREDDVTKVRAEDKASLTVASIPDRIFDGEVIQIRGPAGTNAGASNVIIRTPNPDLMLKPEMSAAVRITVSQSGKVS
jgi:multidrug efflux pump subunit AcrA (membrane-fusion protein)